jgi:hypothetical protein
MFDFVSPFDALTASGAANTPPKRKPGAPAPVAPPQGQSSGEESSMSQNKSISLLEAAARGNAPGGDKRKSVENLLETLNRGGTGPQATQPMEPLAGRVPGLGSRTMSDPKSVPSLQAKLPRPPSPLIHDSADDHGDGSPTPMFSPPHPTQQQVLAADNWKSTAEPKQAAKEFKPAKYVFLQVKWHILLNIFIQRPPAHHFRCIAATRSHPSPC